MPSGTNLADSVGMTKAGSEFAGAIPDCSASDAMFFGTKSSGLAVEKLPSLTLIAGLAVAEAIETVCDLDTALKWPNDVIVRGKKICGILAETTPDLRNVVIGIGVNISRTVWPEDLAAKAISLTETGCSEVDEADLAAEILCRFDRYLEQFLREQNLSPVKGAYEAKLMKPKDGVIILDPQGEYRAEVLGIDDTGALLVKTANGVRRLTAGEISIRSRDGYL